MSRGLFSLALIRHGMTAWNASGRLQGRSDIALSPAGRGEVARWRLPRGSRAWRWHVSPLARARETADLLGIADPFVDERLVEMDWGAWEGCAIAELRAELGEAMALNEARGFDFRPPGGESPRMVLDRFQAFLAERMAEEVSLGIITHRGLMRAVIAHVLGWDLVGKPPMKLLPNSVHFLRVEHDGDLAVERLNQPLDGSPWPDGAP